MLKCISHLYIKPKIRTYTFQLTTSINKTINENINTIICYHLKEIIC